MLRRLTILVLLIVATGGWIRAAGPDAAVKIMTQNMDDGTDVTFVVAALAGAAPLSVPEAVDLTFQELQASDFSGRASLLAGKIAENKPDIVALQEAALWRFVSTTTGKPATLADELKLLLSALKADGVPYEVVAVNVVNQITLPGQSAVAALSFTDRNALLVRSDLLPPAFLLSNVHTHIFAANFSFSGFQYNAGWISAIVHVRGKLFRIVTTHLQTPISGVPAATDVQVAQANELIDALHNSTLPVVLCGDFNSDANGGSFIDATPTAGMIQDAGYAEVWPLLHASDPGLTWPYYLEDQFPPSPFVVPSTPLERIDLFFSQDIEPVSADLVVAPAAEGVTPPFGSDHAGVMAVFHP